MTTPPLGRSVRPSVHLAKAGPPRGERRPEAVEPEHVRELAQDEGRRRSWLRPLLVAPELPAAGDVAGAGVEGDGELGEEGGDLLEVLARWGCSRRGRSPSRVCGSQRRTPTRRRPCWPLNPPRPSRRSISPPSNRGYFLFRRTVSQSTGSPFFSTSAARESPTVVRAGSPPTLRGRRCGCASNTAATATARSRSMSANESSSSRTSLRCSSPGRGHVGQPRSRARASGMPGR